MNSEAGTIFNRYKSFSTVRTFVSHRSGMDFTADKGGTTDFALVLSITAIVVVKIHVRSTTDRTDFGLGNLMTATSFNRR